MKIPLVVVEFQDEYKKDVDCFEAQQSSHLNLTTCMRATVQQRESSGPLYVFLVSITIFSISQRRLQIETGSFGEQRKPRIFC
ncbi:hypothetical protein F2P81_020216 [Scophthalmus maximus]|uniref:Uncharacterized protein n=1 Tax=Scophthalmus maximus TaxID=52904 RepID=A0A6A4S5C4_SCOMX|nr:hypothetical protein F2P81_020216 [Scophthalmus maximus]